MTTAALRLVLLALSLSVPATGHGDAEAPASLPAAELAGPGIVLSGADYHVVSPVEIELYFARYTLNTDFGSFDVWGTDALAERVAEMAALRALDRVSRTDAFAGAVADSVRRTGAALTNVAQDPAGTVRALPAGIGRSLSRALRSARRVAVNVGDALAEGPKEPAADDATGGKARPAASGSARSLIDELAGINRARRELARTLGIDPYTPNPLIEERLHGLAVATAAGGASLNLAMGELSGALSGALSTSRRINDLAWDKPPAELRDLLEGRLRGLGPSGREARNFLRNREFSPTRQLELVEALERLGAVPGIDATLHLAASAQGPLHPRFLIRQLQRLAAAVGSDKVVALRVVNDICVGETGDGRALLVLPLDYLGWSADLASIELWRGARPGLLIVTGRVSARARQTLQAGGWVVRAER